jgi:nitrogen regulatory protein P-II 1
MKKIEAVIQPYKLMDVKEALAEIGVTALTMSEVREADCHGRHIEMYRGQEYTVDFMPRVKLELMVPNNRAERAIAVITKAANTGHDDSGIIAVSSLDDTVRIQNGQHSADRGHDER